jgi:hypothetical protein
MEMMLLINHPEDHTSTASLKLVVDKFESVCDAAAAACRMSIAWLLVAYE